MEYGVNISNKFAFLSGDEDNQDADEIIAKVRQANKQKASALKKEAKKAQVTEKKVNIAPVNTNSVNKENVDNRRPPRRDGPPRNFNGERQNNIRGPPRKTDENGAIHLSGDSQRPPRFNNNRSPRDGQPRRFPPRPRVEGEEGNNNFGENRSQREGGRYNNRRFNGPPRGDRISGSDKTGVRPFPKKDGAGKGNWGTEADEMTTANEVGIDATLNNNKHAENVDHAETEQIEEAADAPVEPQIRELTLEEWKAQHKTEPPKFNIRKPGENPAEKKIYQKLVPIKRTDYEKPEVKNNEEIQVKREPREKALNIEVSFNSSQRRGGGRYRGESGDDRGGYRGERRGPPSNYRGGDRRDGERRSNVPQFNLTQESFPALGAR